MSIESIYEAVEKEYNNLYRDSSLKTPYNGFQGICNAICNNLSL